MHNPLLALSRLGLLIVLWTAIGLLGAGTGVSLKAAGLLQDCALDFTAPQRISGPSSRLDLTLLCPPTVLAELQPGPPRKPDPKLRAVIREAIRQSLPPDSKLGRLEVRAAAPQIRAGKDFSVTAVWSAEKGGPAAPHIPPSAKSSSDAATAKAASEPEYLHGLQAAAAHAGVTRRTIQEWKRRGWLKFEQEGRKIRVARAELDRCSRRR